MRSSDGMPGSSTGLDAGPLAFESPPDPTPSPQECAFYHSIEVPGHPPFQGHWRILRPLEYLGGVDFRGKRVLDVGTSTGFLAFTMENLGAREVIAFDLPASAEYDTRLPVTTAARAHHRARRGLIRNGFWLCHRALGSRVKLLCGDVRSLPEALGGFDVVVLGNVLQHLSDPLRAVLVLAPHAETLVITESCWLPLSATDNPLTLTMFDSDHPFSWFQVRPELLDALLAQHGFAERTLRWHAQPFIDVVDYLANGTIRETQNGNEIPHFTLVARRG